MPEEIGETKEIGERICELLGFDKEFNFQDLTLSLNYNTHDVFLEVRDRNRAERFNVVRSDKYTVGLDQEGKIVLRKIGESWKNEPTEPRQWRADFRPASYWLDRNEKAATKALGITAGELADMTRQQIEERGFDTSY